MKISKNVSKRSGRAKNRLAYSYGGHSTHKREIAECASCRVKATECNPCVHIVTNVTFTFFPNRITYLFFLHTFDPIIALGFIRREELVNANEACFEHQHKHNKTL